MYHFEEEFSPSVDDLNAKTKVYFQVIIDYNRELIKSMIPKTHADKVDNLGPLESKAIKTFDEADEIAQEQVERIHSKFPGSNVKELEPEEQKDEYNVWVANPDGIPIAKIGVIATDYSEATIH